ncbi:ATP-binding cassette domain-containing protein [Allobranchiibius sp. CTAmp26]|uniref:ABC transporter ATP-binding protein/permease n=1 Tax=Allobranchiibius sp. CTAmp26 TaxID=2815214 RepID=UPI001AA17627|nr:ATP-binding cassette domain-containing protein [Allobranchiibius sp. CTAmp26]MBO1753602.1 ATP-binding cassette domain-containing protein [Allobranchiibius sp. CTAmp26]
MTSGDRGFGEPGLWAAARTSVVSASISTVIVLLLGVPLAHWLATSTGPVSRVVTVVVQLPLALPPVMSGIVLIYLVGPYTWLGTHVNGGLTGTTAGVVIAQTFVAAPFLIIAARSAFAERDPALDDLAATLGHGALARFVKVDLPLAAGGIRAGAVLTWLRALGEYGATVLLAYHPYTLPVFTSVQFSATGLPTTQAPTALALGIAVVGLLLAGFRLPRRRHRARTPSPVHPPAARPVPVGFALRQQVGNFDLQLAHRAGSDRLAVLGPSGSGKTLTLRAIAGLTTADGDRVDFAGESVERLAAQRRGVGYVPQNRGLFPHLTVWEHATFGVRADPALAAWWLQTLGLGELLDRRPQELSGGERQRVSLAAALSQHPRVVLLDEPFSALDAPVRAGLQATVRRLQRESGLSTVLVTHDPVEAALLADEVLVIADGVLLQAGPVTEVYRRPASPTVARLVGIPDVAFGTSTSAGTLQAGDCRFPVPTNAPAGAAVTWCVRPQDVVLHPDGAHQAVVEDAADLGSHVAVTLRLGEDVHLAAAARDLSEVPVGGTCRFDVDPSRIVVWADPPTETADDILAK